MSERTTRFVLWIALVLMLPLPLLGLQSGWVPAARPLMLGLVCVAVMLVESTQGVVPILAAIFLGQAALYGLALWLPAFASARALRRARPALRAVIASALVVAGLAATTRIELYRTPYRARSATATLLEVYE